MAAAARGRHPAGADVGGEHPEAGTADAAVRAFVAAMRSLFGAQPAGEWSETTDLVTYAAGLAVPRFNGVVVLGAGADRGAAEAWLGELATRGLPHAILSRPSAPAWVAPLAAGHGLASVEHEPFMCHVDPGAVARTAPGGDGDAFVIDAVDPSDAEEVATGARLLAEGFGAPVEVFEPLLAPEVLALPGMTAYVGRTGGVPCTTGFGAVGDGHVGVFNIATPAAHRNRGFGRAVTARVVADGVRAGAHTAYLQASPMGFGVYRAMGFTTVETWACYYPG